MFKTSSDGRVPSQDSDEGFVRTKSLDMSRQQEFSEAALLQQQERTATIRKSIALSRQGQTLGRESSFRYTLSALTNKPQRNVSWRDIFQAPEEELDETKLLELWEDHQSQFLSHKGPLVPIHPHSVAHFVWNSLVGVAMVICVVLEPVSFAFDSHTDTAWFNGFDRYITVMFFLDLFVQFASGYDDEDGHVEMRVGRVARRYFYGWFVVDFLASLPKEVFAGVPQLSMLKLHKLFSMGLHSMKLSRLGSFLKRLHLDMDVKLSPWTMKMSIWFACLLVWLHFAACATAWVWVESDEDEYRLIDVESIGDNELYEETKCVSRPSCQARYYLRALRTAGGYLVGHGQFSGNTWREDFVVVIFCLSGSILYKSFMAMLLQMLLQRRAHVTKHYRIENQLDQYMGNKQTPLDLRFRVRFYLEQAMDKLGGTTENEVLGQLTKGLRGKIRAQATEKLLQEIPFFNAGPPGFIFRVGQIVSTEVFVADDTIMRAGEVGKEMYIIAEGSVEMLDEDGVLVGVLSEGSYFGENALEENFVRRSTIRAVTEGMMYVIHARQLDQVYDRFPKMKKALLDHTAKMAQSYRPSSFPSDEARWSSDSARRSLDLAPGGTTNGRSSPPMTKGSPRMVGAYNLISGTVSRGDSLTSPLEDSRLSTPKRKEAFMKYFT